MAKTCSETIGAQFISGSARRRRNDDDYDYDDSKFSQQDGSPLLNKYQF